jgi:Tol biopolymer transport system component
VTETRSIQEPEVRRELERVLESKAFSGAQRSRELLRFIVEETLRGRATRLKEYTLAVDALGRGPEFDSRVDPIARVEASRLRQRLELYYATEGALDALVIALPKGGYEPTFTERALQVALAAEPTSGTVVAPSVAARDESAARGGRHARSAALWFALGAGVVAAVAGVSAWRQSAEPRTLAPLVQVDMALGAPGILGSEVGPGFSLSPDGATLVHVALLPDGSTRLFARRLADLTATELPGTSGGRGPFFSPDGRWVGFWAQGNLKKTLVDGGGSPVTITVASDLLGASWGEDGAIVASLDSTGRLMRVPAAGGTPEAIYEAPPGQGARWPQVLPGGAVLFTRAEGPMVGGIVALTPGGEIRDVVPTGSYGRYLSSGHFVYVDRGTLYAAPFDLATLTLDATPQRVLDNVASSIFGYAQFAAAHNGTAVYQRDAGGLARMVWLDGSSAAPTAAVTQPARYLWPRLSPDARQVAVTVLEASDYDLWVYDFVAGTRRRIAGGPGNQGAPVWTPDGRFLVYNDTSAGGMFAIRTDSPAPAELLLPGIRVPWSFAADGRRFAFHEMSPTTGFDLASATIDVRDDGLHASDAAVFHGTKMYETYPTLSPDGKWVAYTSNESDAWEVYVRPFQGDGREIQVSTRGGRIPAWSRTSRDLLFETSDHQLMAASYEIEDGNFVAAPPRQWSPHTLLDTGVLANYDVAPDGRVLALLPVESGSATSRNSVTLVLNFFDELARSSSAD